MYSQIFRKSYCIIIFLIFACSHSFADSPKYEKSALGLKFEKYRNGIVHIGQKKESETQESKLKWLGTGFLLDDMCTFATAKHIFRNVIRDQIVIRFQNPSDRAQIITRPARILYENKKTDIAFLKIDTVGGKPCQSRKLFSFSLLSTELIKSLIGEPIMIIGHPKLGGDDIDIPVLRIGNISSSEILWGSEPMLLLDFIGVPGFSGSPVILIRTGHAVGVVFGPGPTARKFGFEWATPMTLDSYNQAIKQLKPTE
jgi:S1-C subfamily serine protease